MLALPAPCNKVITGGLSIVINEVTTVASVWALQQFMSINPSKHYIGGLPWQIGSDSANVTGMTNAFAQVSQLVNIATGLSGNSTLTSTVTGNSYVPTLTFTTTIVPDTNRIYLVADILAACINTGDSFGTPITCSLLFASVSPSGGRSANDTIQAAYNIATAPGGITEYTIDYPNDPTIPAGTPLLPPGGVACSSVGCEWALQLCDRFVTANPPFPTQACIQGSSTTPSYPTDYAIGVQWSAVDNNGLTYGQEMGAIAVDSNGNIWTGNTGISPGTGYPLVEWSPQGFVMQAVGGLFTMPTTSVPVSVTNTSGTPVFTGGGTGGTYNFSFSNPPMVPLAPGTSPFTPYGLSIKVTGTFCLRRTTPAAWWGAQPSPAAGKVFIRAWSSASLRPPASFLAPQPHPRPLRRRRISAAPTPGPLPSVIWVPAAASGWAPTPKPEAI